MANPIDRRSFLKTTATGLGAAMAGIHAAGCNTLMPQVGGEASMMGFSTQPKDLIKIGFVGIGNMGTSHVNILSKIPGCQVTAVCDIREERTEAAKKIITKAGFPEPTAYGKDENDYVRMCETEELDLVFNAAPWRFHTPICLAAMKNGKHAASEVNIALTIEDCWKLVEASEKYKKHCVMQENCCYDKVEMTVMNMIKKGMFGEIVHGECGYLHDLRALLLGGHAFIKGKRKEPYYQGQWRWHQQTTLDGNLYPTHGIGPMAWCMDIHHGDAFDTMVSMSSNARGLHEYAVEQLGEDHEMAKTDVACGDVNTCIIKTKLGRTIICQHDTHLPRPYSRKFVVQGTKGIMQKYPDARIHIEGISKGHGWENFNEVYGEEYEHPIWTKMKELTKDTGLAGHGGMDFIEDYRLVNALRKGVTPDIDVYDSVAWSAVIPLSIESVKKGGAPVEFPDFTRGKWKQKRELGVFKYEL